MKETLIKLVAEQVSRDESDISMESNFMDDLGADSLDIVELVMNLEEEFGFDIPDDEAEKIQTFGNAVEYILANQS